MDAPTASDNMPASAPASDGDSHISPEFVDEFKALAKQVKSFFRNKCHTPTEFAAAIHSLFRYLHELIDRSQFDLGPELQHEIWALTVMRSIAAARIDSDKAMDKEGTDTNARRYHAAAYNATIPGVDADALAEGMSRMIIDHED